MSHNRATYVKTSTHATSYKKQRLWLQLLTDIIWIMVRRGRRTSYNYSV